MKQLKHYDNNQKAQLEKLCMKAKLLAQEIDTFCDRHDINNNAHEELNRFWQNAQTCDANGDLITEQFKADRI